MWSSSRLESPLLPQLLVESRFVKGLSFSRPYLPTLSLSLALDIIFFFARGGIQGGWGRGKFTGRKKDRPKLIRTLCFSAGGGEGSCRTRRLPLLPLSRLFFVLPPPPPCKKGRGRGGGRERLFSCINTFLQTLLCERKEGRRSERTGRFRRGKQTKKLFIFPSRRRVHMGRTYLHVG